MNASGSVLSKLMVERTLAGIVSIIVDRFVVPEGGLEEVVRPKVFEVIPGTRSKWRVL